jgi:hypothetical protein
VILAIITFGAGQVQGLINVPVSQRSSLKKFIMEDTHAYFDISYEG